MESGTFSGSSRAAHSNQQVKQLLVLFRSVYAELTDPDNGLVQSGFTQSPEFCLQFSFRPTSACQHELESENVSYGFHRLSGERLLCTQHFIWFVNIHAQHITETAGLASVTCVTVLGYRNFEEHRGTAFQRGSNE